MLGSAFRGVWTFFRIRFVFIWRPRTVTSAFVGLPDSEVRRILRLVPLLLFELAASALALAMERVQTGKPFPETAEVDSILFAVGSVGLQYALGSLAMLPFCLYSGMPWARSRSVLSLNLSAAGTVGLATCLLAFVLAIVLMSTVGPSILTLMVVLLVLVVGFVVVSLMSMHFFVAQSEATGLSTMAIFWTSHLVLFAVMLSPAFFASLRHATLE